MRRGPLSHGGPYPPCHAEDFLLRTVEPLKLTSTKKREQMGLSQRSVCYQGGGWAKASEAEREGRRLLDPQTGPEALGLGKRESRSRINLGDVKGS